MECLITLTWNGTTVLSGRVTRTAATDIVFRYFHDNFAGPKFKAWLDAQPPAPLLNGADRLALRYSEETGEASAVVEVSAAPSFPAPAPRDAIGLRDPYVAQCAAETGPDLVGAVLNAAWDLQRQGFGSKSRKAFEAFSRLGSAFVSWNGAPFAFKGPLNPDGEPIESYPRGAALADVTAGTWRVEACNPDGWVTLAGLDSVTRETAESEAQRLANRGTGRAYRALANPAPAERPEPVEPPKPSWESREVEPGKWAVFRPDGTRYGAGPWASKAEADAALGYFAWIAAGGSAD